MKKKRERQARKGAKHKRQRQKKTSIKSNTKEVKMSTVTSWLKMKQDMRTNKKPCLLI